MSTIKCGNNKGRAYRVVNNDQVPTNLSADPVATMIYEDPITRQKEEGLAVLREANPRFCDEDWWDGRVEFLDEPGLPYYARRVYRK